MRRNISASKFKRTLALPIDIASLGLLYEHVHMIIHNSSIFID
jgi:hypothetical protein